MSNISFNPLAWAIRPLYTKAIADDPTFAQEVKEKESRAEKPKSLEECAEYILGEAFEWASNHRQGNIGFSGLPDDEVVNLIKTYYQNDDIVIKEIKGASASVSTTPTSKPANADSKADAKSRVVKVDTSSVLRTPVSPNPSEPKKEEGILDLFAGMDEDDDDLPM